MAPPVHRPARRDQELRRVWRDQRLRGGPMNAVLLGQLDPNTPEWDEIRSRGIGGSEIAAVVGLSPWVSRFALWHRKRGTLGKQTVNAGMDWGHRLEDAICEAWAEK